MIDVDAYLTRRITTENCWHIVRDAWLELTGIDVGDRTPERMAKDALIGRFETDVPQFTRQDGPVDPSIVLMRQAGRVPHVGVLTGGRVLQLVGRTISYMPPEKATAGWSDVGYYR